MKKAVYPKLSLIIALSMLVLNPPALGQAAGHGVSEVLRMRSENWTLKDSISFKNLTIFPITVDQADPRSYKTLGAALKHKQLRIREHGTG